MFQQSMRMTLMLQQITFPTAQRLPFPQRLMRITLMLPQQMTFTTLWDGSNATINANNFNVTAGGGF